MLRLWDVGTWRERAALRLPEAHSPAPLTFSPDGKLLAAAVGFLNRGRPMMWEADTCRELPLECPRWLCRYSPDYIVGLRFSPDARTLAIATDETVGLWDVAGGRNTAAFGRGRGPLSLQGLMDWAELCDPVRNWGTFVTSVYYAPDGRLMALGKSGTEAEAWPVRDIPVGRRGLLRGIGAALALLATTAWVHRAVRGRVRRLPSVGDRPAISPSSSAA